MRAIARLAQFAGLSLPVLAAVLEFNGSITAGPMLVMLVFAVCCFWLGRILEGYAGP